jgi:hypothetical protein
MRCAPRDDRGGRVLACRIDPNATSASKLAQASADHHEGTPAATVLSTRSSRWPSTGVAGGAGRSGVAAACKP